MRPNSQRVVEIKERGYVQIPDTVLQKEKLKPGDYLHLTNSSGIILLQRIKHRSKASDPKKDLEILNQNSEYLNQEAEDVLTYQVML